MRAVIFLLVAPALAAPLEVSLRAPESVRQFEIAEFVVEVARPELRNPFTEVELSGEFRALKATRVAQGFCDSPDGRVYRLRFAPPEADVTYEYTLRLRAPGGDRNFSGKLRSERSAAPGPVVVDPANRKHFRSLGSGKPFYHLGFTAYHLLDPSHTDQQIDATIDYCARMGFNKIRFLLSGYPRDTDRRTSTDVEHGVPDPWRRPNYGAPPGSVNPLPAWEGKPHGYDFTRFHLPHWRRAERAIAKMRERGIVATAILTIEKQDLPREYGRLSEHEFRFYRYAIARLSAFENVWWDLGNEHNEFRDEDWGDAMGHFLKATDPHGRLRSAHAYAEFFYTASGWPSYIITQQYGDEYRVHSWARKYESVPMPYVNEEYGYEGSSPKPGHAQDTDWVRRNHWSIAMAGGYATYGDWSDGVSYFYMGEPGPGKAPAQLKLLRQFFEALPFHGMRPREELATQGFCLAAPPEVFVFYLPRGGGAEISLGPAAGGKLAARWFNPRTGEWRDGPAVRAGKVPVQAPDANDWVLLVR